MSHSCRLSGPQEYQPSTADMHEVVDHFQMKNIVLQTMVEEASYADGIWTLRIKNLVTGEESIKTCNVFISAVGGLREPSIPGFAANNKDFEGEVFHTAQWDHSVDIKGKHLVLVGNGCSAAQVVPNIVNDVASVTQVARSRQSYLPVPNALPTNWFWFKLLKWIPGVRHDLSQCVSCESVLTSPFAAAPPPAHRDLLCSRAVICFSTRIKFAFNLQFPTGTSR